MIAAIYARATALAALILALAGCAHGFVAPLPPVDPARAAELVVVRASGFFGCGRNLVITLDGRDLFALGCGEHIRLVVAAGERIVGVVHHPWFVRDESTTAVAVEPHQRYFLRVTANAMNDVFINRIAPEVGERLVTETKSAER